MGCFPSTSTPKAGDASPKRPRVLSPPPAVGGSPHTTRTIGSSNGLRSIDSTSTSTDSATAAFCGTKNQTATERVKDVVQPQDGESQEVTKSKTKAAPTSAPMSDESPISPGRCEEPGSLFVNNSTLTYVSSGGSDPEQSSVAGTAGREIDHRECVADPSSSSKELPVSSGENITLEESLEHFTFPSEDTQEHDHDSPTGLLPQQRNTNPIAAPIRQNGSTDNHQEDAARNRGSSLQNAPLAFKPLSKSIIRQLACFSSVSMFRLLSNTPLATEIRKRYEGGFAAELGGRMCTFLTPVERRAAMASELKAYRTEIKQRRRSSAAMTMILPVDVTTATTLALQNAIKGEGMLWAHPSFYDGLPMPLTAFSAEDESTMNQEAPQLFSIVSDSSQVYQRILRDLPFILLTFSRGDFPATMSLLERSSNSVSTAGLRCSERVKVCLVQLEACIRDFAVLVWKRESFTNALARHDFDNLSDSLKNTDPNSSFDGALQTHLHQRVQYVAAVLSITVSCRLQRTF